MRIDATRSSCVLPAISNRLVLFRLFISLSLSLVGPCSLAALLNANAQFISRLSAADATNGDQFGVDVALHQETLLVGAFWDDDNGSASGSAYLFAPNPSGEWEQIQKLLAPDGSTNDWFGMSVALHGDWAVVGAPLQDEAGRNAGAAYLFQRDPDHPNRWIPRQKLMAADAAEEDWFGWSLAMNSELLAIGAYQSDASAYDSGAIYIFRPASGTNALWVETTKLTSPVVEPAAWLGFSLALHGHQILAGAPFDAPGGLASGAAYLFTPDGSIEGNWSSTRLIPAAPQFDQQFGWSVAVQSGLVAVGARLTDYAAPMGGAVYLFHPTGSAGWEQFDVLVPQDNEAADWFGESIALSASTLAVGVRLDDDQGSDSGSAYLFRPDARGRWIDREKLLAQDGAIDFRFGESIALDEDLLLVGSFADEHPSFGYAAGAAYLYSVAVPQPVLQIESLPDNLIISWDPPIEAELMISTDLVHWNSLSARLPPLIFANEGELMFFELGSL